MRDVGFWPKVSLIHIPKASLHHQDDIQCVVVENGTVRIAKTWGLRILGAFSASLLEKDKGTPMAAMLMTGFQRTFASSKHIHRQNNFDSRLCLGQICKMTRKWVLVLGVIQVRQCLFDSVYGYARQIASKC